MLLKSELISKWKVLNNLRINNKNLTIKNLFDEDSNRAAKYTLGINDFKLDFSRNYINQEILNELVQYLNQINLSKKIDDLFSGSIVNKTENKPALHTLLRNLNSYECQQELQSLEKFYTNITTNHDFDTVINIGIGGSHLGPELLYQALNPYLNNKITCHFVSNIDPENIYQILNEVNLKKTIFIVSSKSFSTDETLTNYKIAYESVKKICPDNLNNFFAITANKDKALELGINKNNIITFNNNIGGRYSISSAISLPFIISSNFDIFKKFLAGANHMDNHYKNTSFNENLPVILALLDFWYINFYNINNRAVIPYSYNLKLLPKYLQQLVMESNGKNIDNNLNSILYSTSNIIWGDMGTNVQHSFFQLLHQGTNIIPCDFIIPLESNIKTAPRYDNGIKDIKDSHKKLLTNAFAQIETLATGTINNQNYKNIIGNKPTNVILFNKLTPENLGMLISLYEQKTYTLGVIWDINCFDQFGVEHGKVLANKLLDSSTKHDFSTINNLNSILENYE